MMIPVELQQAAKGLFNSTGKLTPNLLKNPRYHKIVTEITKIIKDDIPLFKLG